MPPDKNNDDLSAIEREKFAALSRERLPAPALEARMISLLKSKELIHMTRSQKVWTLPRLAGAFAAALVLLIGGFGLGKWQNRPASSNSALPVFLMLLHESSTVDEDEADKIIEYGQWAHTIAQAKQLRAGAKLQDDGRFLQRVGGQLEVLEVSAKHQAEQIGGYFLIQAENYEQAIKIASGCPHLKYGGLIELRQIERI